MKSAFSTWLLALQFFHWAHATGAPSKNEKVEPNLGFTQTVLSCASQVAGQKTKRKHLIRHGVIADLPESLPMAYAVNHRFLSRNGEFTIYSSIPLPGRKKHSRLDDLARWGLHTPLPKRFVVGDGKNHRALIGVDLNPGSPLSKQIERIRKTIQWMHGDQVNEQLIELIAKNNAHQLGPVIRTEEERKAKVAALPWDGLADDAPVATGNFKILPVDHDPIAAHFSLPVVPLEEMILRGEAYCLGQALLAWILLREYKVGSRLLLGANATADGHYTGHTSVQIVDGSIVDPAGWLVIPPRSLNDPHNYNGDFRFPWRFVRGFSSYLPGSDVPQPTWRFEYARYPFVVLED